MNESLMLELMTGRRVLYLVPTLLSLDEDMRDFLTMFFYLQKDWKSNHCHFSPH